MRLIDADKLKTVMQEGIENAKKLIVEHPVDKLDQVANDTAKSWIHAYKEVIKKIESCESMFKTDSSDRWIPCSERMPEADEYILLSFSNYSGLVLGRYEEDDGGGAFCEGDSLTPLTQYDVFVNAWMPLPKPYRELE